MATCRIEGCALPVVARSVCGPHYSRFRVYGDYDIVTTVPEVFTGTVLTRDHFEWSIRREESGRRGKKLINLRKSLLHDLPDDACWPWAGRRGRNGYGIAVVPGSQGRGTTAHRMVWVLLHGDVDDDAQIDHMCHIPSECTEQEKCAHRSCVNPRHLRVTDALGNLLNSNSFIAENYAKAHCNKGHPFSPENTYVSPNGRRTCRTCQRDNWRRYDEKKRKSIA